MTTLRRTTVIAIAALVASLLPVIDMTPAYAAPETDAAGLSIPAWTVEAASDGSPTPWRTSAVVPGDGVVMLGADLSDHDGLRVQVRSRRDDAWSEWTELESSHDHAPDDGAADAPDDAPGVVSDVDAPAPSEPVWVGSVDALQVRTTSTTPAKVKFHTVRIDGGEDALRATAQTNGPASSAEAATTKPAIITRAQWGADESKRNDKAYYASDVRFAVVHHTAGSNSYERWESDDIVRSIYAYHTGSRGWDDIGYNFLVDQYGQVFEGRAGGIEKAVIGAHAGGFNSGSTGVAVMGNFAGSAPPAAAITGLQNLLAWKLDVHHVDPLGATKEVAGGGTRFKEGSTVTLPTIIGHRDVGYTECPGSVLYARITDRSVAKSVAGIGTPKLYTTSPSSVTAPRGEPVEVLVKPSGPVSWRLEVRDATGVVRLRRHGSSSGKFTVAWDHRMADGELAPLGSYTMAIDASSGGSSARPIVVAAHVVTRPPQPAAANPTPIPPPAGATLVQGDWDGDGIVTPGWFKDGQWGMHDRSLREGHTWRLEYGRKGDKPVVGDWDGDGVDTIGVVRGNRFILRNVYRSGADDIVMEYGRPTDKPVVGDWDGNGTTTLGVVRGNRFILRNVYKSGADDIVLDYGRDSDTPVVGDWDGNGTTTLGVVRGNRFILRNVYKSGADDIVMEYGRDTDTPVVGDWDGNGTTTLGVVRGDRWILRNEYRSGALDYDFRY